MEEAAQVWGPLTYFSQVSETRVATWASDLGLSFSTFKLAMASIKHEKDMSL